MNEKRRVLSDLDLDGTAVDPAGDPSYDDSITRSGGGTLEWKQTLYGAEGSMTSSPAFVDLNNDGKLEVVIASEGDFVFALSQGGNFFWNEPYSDDIIDYLGETPQTSGLDFEPPHIFSSVIAADVNLGDNPEVIIGVKDGALCLGADGEKQWKKGLTSGYYFSTAAITDLEGVWSGDKEDLEIVMASDDENKHGWIEAFEVDGGAIFREEAPTLNEGGLIGCSVVAHDLDGDFWEGPKLINPDLSKERDTEVIIGNHDKGLRIWVRQGENSEGKPNYDESLGQNLGGHQTYATTAVANVTGSPDCELFVGSCEGSAVAWNGWGGKLYAYTPEGRRLWEYSTGSARASIISSPAIADLQVAKDDPDEKVLDYEIVFGCDNGNVYVIDADDHSMLWSFQTGGRVLSSPAICNIDNDDELEIIIGSNSGKVFCFDGDPTDGIDEGVPYPGDGPNQDVLWVYDTKVSIGISSPVVADYDLDGQLEVAIGDTEGNVYCISAGGRAVTGQQDWTEFHGNLNRTGFYNPQTSFGVDIRPARDPESDIADTMVKSVEPGEFVTYNMTIENTGKGITKSNRDRITVKVDEGSVPDGWSAWLDTPSHKGDENPGYVMLASQETADLTLYVYAPWEGDVGEMVRINVTANSTRDRFSVDDITTLTILNLYVDFDISFMKTESMDPIDPLYGKKTDRINPGGEGLYPLSIINKGNINDSYEIKLVEPPSFTGWDWYFVETGSRSALIRLESGIFAKYGAVNGESLNVKIVCPEDALKDTQVPVIVEGVSVLSMNSEIESKERCDELIMVVGEHNMIQLRIDDSTRYAYPNETVEFKLLVSNTGNNDRVNVRLIIEGSKTGWVVRHTEEAVPVIQDQTKPVPIRIRVPRDARAEDKLVLSVVGIVEGASQYRSQAMLNVIVKQLYSFDASVLQKEGVTVNEGETADISIQVSNLGNGDDRIVPNIYQIPKNWNMTCYNDQGYQKHEVDLPYDGEIFITARLAVPSGTRAGDYLLGINLTGDGSSRIVITKVMVNQTHDLEIRSTTGSAYVNGTIAPNQDLTVVLTVTNNGNGWEDIDLFLGSQFDEVRGSMKPLHEGWIGKIVAVSNTPDFTTNIRQKDFRKPIVVSNLVADVYYTPDLAAAESTGTNLDEIREINIGMDMGMTAWIHVVFRAPSDEINDLKEATPMQAAAVGGGPDSYDLVDIGLTVLFPDLVFSKQVDGSYIQISGDRSEGNVITITARIANNGDISTENVDVTLMVDGKEKKTQTLRSIKHPEGGNQDVKTVIFSWVAEAGEHEITIVIDPDNTVIESADQFIHQGANNYTEVSM
ncbi:MAG: CARDB domain-containing protein [Thermoplasmatota archaeon]